ncbi:hypothetical protein ACHAWF_017420 [Thalassiosira exigua]
MRPRTRGKLAPVAAAALLLSLTVVGARPDDDTGGKDRTSLQHGQTGHYGHRDETISYERNKGRAARRLQAKKEHAKHNGGGGGRHGHPWHGGGGGGGGGGAKASKPAHQEVAYATAGAKAGKATGTTMAHAAAQSTHDVVAAPQVVDESVATADEGEVTSGLVETMEDEEEEHEEAHEEISVAEPPTWSGWHPSAGTNAGGGYHHAAKTDKAVAHVVDPAALEAIEHRWDADWWSGAGGGGKAAKAAKAAHVAAQMPPHDGTTVTTTTMADPDPVHDDDWWASSGASGGKGGKAAYGTHTYIEGSKAAKAEHVEQATYAKAGKTAPLPWGEGHEHAEQVEEYHKPKAEKAELTHFFVKEQTSGGGWGSSTTTKAKASKSKAGKGTEHEAVDWWGAGAKSAKVGGWWSGGGSMSMVHGEGGGDGDGGGTRPTTPPPHDGTSPSPPSPPSAPGDPPAPEPATPGTPGTAPEPAPTPPDAGSPAPGPDDGGTPPTDAMETLSPLPAPDGAATAPPTTEDEDEEFRKWWPEEDPDDPDTFSCVYSDEYTEHSAYEDAEFVQDYLFDKKRECCEAWPNADNCGDDDGSSGDNGGDGGGTPSPTVVVEPAPGAPGARSTPFSMDDKTEYPTYSPTSGESDDIVSMRGAQGEGGKVVLEPFGLKLFAKVAEPNWNKDTIKRVTMEHLIHSFRTKSYQAKELALMELEEERRLMKHPPGGNVMTEMDPIVLRSLAQHPVIEIIFGGVMDFPFGTATPDKEETEDIVKASFTGDRLGYYMELLNEAGIDVNKVKLDVNPAPPGAEGESKRDSKKEGFNWAGFGIGMSSAIGGVGLLAYGSRAYRKRQERRVAECLEDLDLEKSGDYAIRLQYSNDGIEAFPGSTVAETLTASDDHLSVPSLVRGREDRRNFTLPMPEEGEGEVSPLESPREAAAAAAAAAAISSSRSAASTPTRYVSVFTVKKDCGGRALEDVDLRSLAVSYLSRMLKKFPNTHLLPHDKNAPLPAIMNVRNIPDDLDELTQYVGNARIDDRTGKVCFDLRVEGDEPVSKMKERGGIGGRASGRSRTSTSPRGSGAGGGASPSSPPVGNTRVKSIDEMEAQEMPTTPGSFEDVKL